MKAVLSLIWIYLTAYPLQRWITLGCIGLLVAAAIGAGIAAASMGDRGLTVGIVMMLVPLVILFLPAILATGVAFRALASCHANQLIPWFRVKTFLSLLAICLLIAAVYTALITLTDQQDALTTVDSFMAVLAVVSAMIYFVFRVTAPNRWLVLELLVLLLMPRLFSDLSGLGFWTQLGPVVVIGAWGAFAAWYLSGRPVRPLDLTGQTARGRQRGVPASPERWPATMALVTMRYPAPLLQELSLGVLFVCGIAAFIWVMQQVLGGDQPFPLEAAVVGGAIIGTLALIEFFRRSRLLWLLLGSRLEIFATMERVALRLCLQLSLILGAFLILLHLTIQPVTAGRAAALAGLTVGLVPLILYSGLASIRGIDVIAVALTAVILLGAIALTVLAAIPGPNFVAILAIAGTLLGLTIVVRNLAKRRWRSIDWRTFRPRSIKTRFLPP
jgi:hypothetical protein